MLNTFLKETNMSLLFFRSSAERINVAYLSSEELAAWMECLNKNIRCKFLSIRHYQKYFHDLLEVLLQKSPFNSYKAIF